MANKNIKKENKFYKFIGIIIGIGAFATLGQSVYSGIIQEFWTFRWIFTILITILTLGLSIFLYDLGSINEDASAPILFVYGMSFMIFSVIIFFWFDYQLITEQLSVGEYFGLSLQV